MKQHGVRVLLSARSILVKGRFSDHRKVRSSMTASSLSIALIIWPMGSRAAQRLTLATASFASTDSPSWNFSPGRRRKVQLRPSEETSSDSTICRWGSSLSLMP
jgi:hypothetical protein